MEINREKAMDLWEERYGDKKEIKDFSGRTILKGSYGQTGSKYGWNIDHILPKAHGGTNKKGNLIICHIETNAEKGDSYPNFVANDSNWQIVNSNGQYKIIKQDNNANYFWEFNPLLFGDCSSYDKINTPNLNIRNKQMMDKWIGVAKIKYSPSHRNQNILNINHLSRFFHYPVQKKTFVQSYGEEIVHLLSWKINKTNGIQNIFDSLVDLKTCLFHLRENQKNINDYKIYFYVKKWNDNSDLNQLNSEVLNLQDNIHRLRSWEPNYDLVINGYVKNNITKNDEKFCQEIDTISYILLPRNDHRKTYGYTAMYKKINPYLKKYFNL